MSSKCWTTATFRDSDEAESALCQDRPNFLARHDIIQLVPSTVMKPINHFGDVAQITGFQELFILLNQNPNADVLRKLIVDYFNDSPILRHHLRCPGEGSLPFLGGHIARTADMDVPTRWDSEHGPSAQSLNPIASAAYNSYEMASRASCFEGTRYELIERIMKWLHGNNERQPIYILHGVAGIGKSTVAKSVAERAATMGALGASFFFSRSEGNRKTARSFFPTLAHQLASRDEEFARQLSAALVADGAAAKRDLQGQFSSLIGQNLRREGDPILLIVDALDECEENDAVTILDIFAQEIHQLRRLKVFITARPERHIRNALDVYRNHERFCLQDIEQSIVEADIRLYLGSRLSEKEVLRALPELPPPPWQPTPEQTNALVRMSEKLFIIASTAVDFILDGKQLAPAEQLGILLSSLSPRDFSGSRHTFLDKMYMRIIRAACPKPVGSWLDRFQIIVGTITLLQDLLPYNALAKLLGIDANDIIRTLANLHSLIPLGEKNKIFQTHHKSFPDFITDPRRREHSGKFCIDPIVHHLRIAKCCLRVMNSNLKRDLEFREWREDGAPAHCRPQDDMSHLEYACCYWATHLGLAAKSSAMSLPDDEAMQLLEYFTSHHLRAWTKVLGSVRGIYPLHFNIFECKISNLKHVMADKTFSDRAAYAGCLGSALGVLFTFLGRPSDLDLAITAQQQAVQLTQDSHPHKPGCLNNLGSSFLRRFEHLGDVGDVDEAITTLQQAVQLTPDGHPDKPGYLNNLGNSFLCRFERFDDISDVGEAIMNQQQAVQLTPDGHPDKPGRLNNLGSSFLRQFERLGNIGDVGEAITTRQQAVQLTPDGHLDKPGYLNNLGNSFLCRFGRLGDIGDVDEAITNQRQAVHLTPEGHPHMPGRLNNLGSSLLRRFECLGNIGHVDEAITNQQKAVQLTPDGHPGKPGRLNNLGSSFLHHFERLGDIGDVGEAIMNQQQAIQLTPDGHPDKPRYLNNLGNSYLCRFERLSDIGDIDEAITDQQQAVQLAPHSRPHKPRCLNNLRRSFSRRFECLGDISDIDEAIMNQQQAVQLTPDGHPDTPRYLNNLGNSFLCRFEHLRDIGDVNEAITIQQQAVQLIPDGHPNKPELLNNLRQTLLCRFGHLGDTTSAPSSPGYGILDSFRVQ